MVREMAPRKCVVCASKSNLQKLNENINILGKELLTIINNLCATEQVSALQQHSVNDESCICVQCSIEILYVDQILKKLRKAFTNKSEKLNIADKATTTTATTTNTTPSASTNLNTADDYLFNCKICEFNTLKLKLYRAHMLKKHNENISKPYHCKLCKDNVADFTRYDHYAKHQLLSHAPKEITIKQELPEDHDVIDEAHEELEKDSDAKNDEHHVGDIFKCLECTYETDKPKLFNNHMIKVHNADKNNIFRCTMCKKSYGRVHAYKQHLEFMHMADGSERLPQFSCNYCDRKFYQKNGLMVHMRHAHVQEQAAAVAAETTTTTTTNNNNINEETMLNGATATSTPLNNNKNNSTADNAATIKVSTKNKRILNLINSTNGVDSKKHQATQKLSNLTENNSIVVVSKSFDAKSVSGNVNGSNSMKRKLNAEAETLCNGNTLKKKKKKNPNKDLTMEVKEISENTQEKEEEAADFIKMKKKKKKHIKVLEMEAEESSQNTQEEEEEEISTCKMCWKTFSSGKKLARHIIKKHNN